MRPVVCTARSAQWWATESGLIAKSRPAACRPGSSPGARSGHFGSSRGLGHCLYWHQPPFVFRVIVMAALLLVDLHGRLLPLLAERDGVHYEGLAVAARRVRAALPRKLIRHMCQLDTTCAVIRHIISPLADCIVRDVEKALRRHVDGPVCAPELSDGSEEAATTAATAATSTNSSSIEDLGEPRLAVRDLVVGAEAARFDSFSCDACEAPRRSGPSYVTALSAQVWATDSGLIARSQPGACRLG